MQTRLGFAVAAHLKPEILIVDEVLAVGDHEFQKRCLGKMHEVSQGGRTVLFVTHNMNTLGSLTSRCIHLAQGKVVRDGPTHEIVAEYLAGGEVNHPLYESPERGDTPKLLRVEVRTSKAGGLHSFLEPLELRFKIWCPRPIRGACLSAQINDLNRLSCSANPWLFDSEMPYARERGVHEVVCFMPKARLFVGSYNLTVRLTEPPGGLKFDQQAGICGFQVECLGKQRLDYAFEPGEAAYMEDCEWQVLARDSIE
jgi:lipopolysaccharide transport system ATP-binding protein